MNVKKHNRLTRALCLLLCCLLMLNGCASGRNTDTTAAPETSQASQAVPETSAVSEETEPVAVLDVPDEIVPAHADINYEGIVYERPDLDAIYQTIDTIISLAAEENSQEALFEAYDTVLEQLRHLDTMDTLASLKNSIDLTDSYYEEEMNLLDNEYVKIDNRMNDATETILQSPYADAFTERMGTDFIERYQFNSTLNSPAIEELSEQENALVTKYNSLFAKEYTTVYNGKEVTLDDLDYSDPDSMTPYYEIYAQRNAECAEIYSQLVKIRVQIAQTLGYDSYIDYAYDLLGRDFTKEDSSRFCQMVKQYLVPVYTQLYNAYYTQLALALSSDSMTLEDGIPCLKAALENEFPAAMSEALDYMLDHHWYYYDDDSKMTSGAFTTIINDYSAPFMFINLEYYDDPGTLFHEFGHYYNFYLMGDIQWNDSNNLDLAEVHSQGLELLMLDHYSELYSNNAESMQVYVILNLMNSILQGCCQDEFQQRVFENPDMTIDEMNELQDQLCQEYASYSYYYEWVDIHHHFETPFYYISYATSAVSAFEIWELANSSRAAGLAAYRSITQNTLNSGYLEPLADAGLSNPFTSDMVKKLAETISKKYLSDSAAN